MLTRLLHAIVAQPIIYNAVQFLAGATIFRERAQGFIQGHLGDSVLDIGCGTGLHRDLVGAARYFGLDNDPLKLAGLRMQVPDAGGVILGDGAALGLKNKSLDTALCIFVTHHLTDEQLKNLIAETARVVRHTFFLADAIRHPHPLSRLLWRYDRGRYPRTQAELSAALQTHFEVEKTESFRILHRYVLFRCTPRS